MVSEVWVKEVLGLHKTIKKIGHVLFAIFRPRNIALFVFFATIAYFVGMFLFIFGSVLFDMYVKKRPNFPEIKALRQEMRSAYPNISNVDIFYSSYGSNDIYIVVETKVESLTEEEAFHLACMVREMAMEEEFQQEWFDVEKLKVEQVNFCTPNPFLQIMGPGKKEEKGDPPEYKFGFRYFKETFSSLYKSSAYYTYEGYAVFHCAKSFDPYIEEYLAQEEAAAG